VDKSLRQLLFALSPAIRRLFYFDLFLYYTVSIVSLVLLIPRRIVVKQAIFILAAIFAFGIFSFFVDLASYVKYVPLLFFLLFYQTIGKNVKSIGFNQFVCFFFLAAVFSVYQNVLGFSQYDIAFLNSGVGKIAAEGHLSHVDIRPFSLFSGVGEATFFYLFSAVYFMKRGNYLLLLVAIYLAILTGSRGVLVGFMFSFFWMTLFSKVALSKSKLIWLSIIFGVVLYLSIFFAASLLSFLQSQFEDNRLLFFGPMKGRYYYLLDFASMISISNIILPVFSKHYILDNILATLWNDFGFIGAVLLLYYIYGLFYRQEFWPRVFLATFIIYGYFSDQILSLYLLVVFNFGINLITTISMRRTQ